LSRATRSGLESLDGAAGNGVIADMIVTEFNATLPLDDTATVDMTLVPDARSETAPTIGTGSGGA
jgi:hypothetical protein